MPAAKVGDINIEYFVEGEGPPLLMIMGLGGQARSWGEPFLERLTPRFQTIRFSNRGTGLTDKPAGPYGIKMMADDAAGLLQELGIPKAHVMGISMGGMIAQELVLNHPDAVQGLVLGCTFCGPAHSVPVPMETVSRMGQITGLTMEERVQEFWKLTVTEPFIESGKEFLDGIIRVHLDMPTPWATFGFQFAAVQQFDTFDRLPAVKAPTLIIHGDKDILVPYANAEVLHKQIPGSRVHTVKDVGHCFFWEKPEESATAVVEFLSSVPAPV